MALYQKKIIYLSQTDYNTLYNSGAKDGQITKNGTTYSYDENALYMTPNEIDSTPTANSDNPITSGGVYTALALKANDANVVHLANNETISGTKTFNSTISGSISGNAATATALTSSAGNNALPIYFRNGKPEYCTSAISWTKGRYTSVYRSSSQSSSYSQYYPSDTSYGTFYFTYLSLFAEYIYCFGQIVTSRAVGSDYWLQIPNPIGQAYSNNIAPYTNRNASVLISVSGKTTTSGYTPKFITYMDSTYFYIGIDENSLSSGEIINVLFVL